jgi:MYXO-CTERM domain-containing protein
MVLDAVTLDSVTRDANDIDAQPSDVTAADAVGDTSVRDINGDAGGTRDDSPARNAGCGCRALPRRDAHPAAIMFIAVAGIARLRRRRSRSIATTSSEL